MRLIRGRSRKSSSGRISCQNASTRDTLVKNRCPPMSKRQPSRSTVRLIPPTTSSASKTRTGSPCRSSSYAAVSPAGPAPMIDGAVLLAHAVRALRRRPVSCGSADTRSAPDLTCPCGVNVPGAPAPGTATPDDQSDGRCQRPRNGDAGRRFAARGGRGRGDAWGTDGGRAAGRRDRRSRHGPAGTGGRPRRAGRGLVQLAGRGCPARRPGARSVGLRAGGLRRLEGRAQPGRACWR